MNFPDLLKAVLYGIVEGITEWLPVSSTGHLILLSDRFPLTVSSDPALTAAFFEMFEVVIQLGAVLAVAVLYRKKLFRFSGKTGEGNFRRTLNLWLRVAVGCIPAALAGVVGDRLLERYTGKDVDGWLYRPAVVAAALILYGIAFLFFGKWERTHPPVCRDAENVPWRTALGIGVFQALSMIPGTSRSGATILGGTLFGLSRGASAEFSFWMALPIMAGAGGVKAIGFARDVSGLGTAVPAGAYLVLAVGCAVSFAVSVLAIRFLTDFVRRHGLAGFGVYRILLGGIVLADGLLCR